MGAHIECLRDLRGGTHRPYRHTAAHRFRHSHDVRFDPVVHKGHDLAGAAPACLDFVDQKQHVLFPAKLGYSVYKILRPWAYTAFALNEFQHNTDRIVRYKVSEGVEVAEVCVRKSRKHRTKADLTRVMRLSRRREAAESTPVEAVFGRDDMKAFRTVFFDAIFTRHFYHGFVGLGPGVLIEDFVISEQRADFLRKKGLGNQIGIVKRMDNVVQLSLNSSYDRGIPAARAVHSDSTVKVEIFFALLVV